MNFPEDLISRAIADKCSDVHLTEGGRPLYRRNGRLIPADAGAPGRQDIFALLPAGETPPLPGEDRDFSAAFAGGRQRVNIFWESGRCAAAVRLLSDVVPTIEELGLPPVLKVMAMEPRGLILVTGPTGSGKSTTLAAMVNYIAYQRPCHIITIEDPIEYVYGDTPSLIHQREVGRDAPSFASALRSSLREDPDVMLVGEMRDFETISAAITAAETGHLVLSTLHTTGAARTVDRIIDTFPPHAQNQIRAQLAGNLKGVVTQQLLPTADGQGRAAATEIMIGTDAISSMIREGKCHQINSVIQSGGTLGMHTLERSLADMIRSGRITRDTAVRCSSSPGELNSLLAAGPGAGLR